MVTAAVPTWDGGGFVCAHARPDLTDWEILVGGVGKYLAARLGARKWYVVARNRTLVGTEKGRPNGTPLFRSARRSCSQKRAALDWSVCW